MSWKRKLRHLHAYVTYMRGGALPSDPRHVFVAAFPKAGSTFLRESIAALPGFRNVNLVTGFDRREQELSVECLCAWHDLDYVARHHTGYSEVTQELMNRFHLRPVVLVRNLPDVIVSLRDHMRRESVRLPMAYCGEDVVEWEDERAFDFIVDMMVPWYLNFYVGWLDCPEQITVRYEDIHEDMQSVMVEVVEGVGIEATREEIRDAIGHAESQFTRKNVARVGRGREVLSDSLWERIKGLAAYYEDVDFSPIGIV